MTFKMLPTARTMSLFGIAGVLLFVQAFLHNKRAEPESNGGVEIAAGAKRERVILLSDFNGSRRSTWRQTFTVRAIEDSQSIQLVYLGSDCGCTRAAHDDRPIRANDVVPVPAGGSTSIFIEQDVPAYERQYTNHVFFRGLRDRPLDLSLTTLVVADLQVRPEAVVWDSGDSLEDSASKTITIRDAARNASELASGFECIELPSAFTVHIKKRGGVRRLANGLVSQFHDVTVRRRQREEADDEGYRGVFRVRAVSRERENGATAVKEAAVPYVIASRRPLRCIREVCFGVVKDGEASHRRIMLESRGQAPFSVVSVRVSTPALAVDCCTKAAKEQWIDVTFRPTPTEEISGWFEITTDLPRQGAVKVITSAYRAEF